MPVINSFEIFVLGSVPIAVGILTFFIILNFMYFQPEEEKQKYVKSKVETFSMYGFALVCYLIIMQKIGFYRFNNLFRFLSAVFIYISVIVNIWGRVVLKANWSNQIRIRKEHELVTNGPFRFVRHPLYTTTIAMVYFAGVCYNNYLVLILNTVIFIPMMVYRAKQEEKELSVYVAGYEEYMSRVGRLFPRLK